MRALFIGWFWLAFLATQEARADNADSPPAGFEGWPESWSASYRRFDAFIEARRAHWQPPNLEILDDGTISHGFRLATSTMEHLSLVLFNRGRRILDTGMSENLFGQGREQIIKPGIYATYLNSCGLLGYQHLGPIIWFEVSTSPAGEGFVGRGNRARHIRTIAAPGEGEEIWPNERIFDFLDFHVIPHRFPQSIQEANARVKPAVALRLNNLGVIERERLADEAAERLLRWRIYYNGRLIEKGSAAGLTRLETDHGSGTYQALAGVEGPNGFMPVSNLVEYPLFPDAAGKHVVIPVDANRDGVPDCVGSLVEGPAAGAADRDGDFDNDGLSNREEGASPERKAKSGLTGDARQLLELWRAWSYDLKNREPFKRLSKGGER